MRYNWPGNIRELENAIERAVLLTEGPQLTSVDLRLGELSTTQPSGDASPVVKIPPTGIALEEIERQALIEALKMSNWVQKDAAELLAISPRVMNYKIKTLGIDYRARTTADGGSRWRARSQLRVPAASTGQLTAASGCQLSSFSRAYAFGWAFR